MKSREGIEFYIFYLLFSLLLRVLLTCFSSMNPLEKKSFSFVSFCFIFLSFFLQWNPILLDYASFMLELISYMVMYLNLRKFLLFHVSIDLVITPTYHVNEMSHCKTKYGPSISCDFHE